MRSVYKFKLDLLVERIIRLPKGAKFLYAGTQGTGYFAWFEVDPDAELEERRFIIHGTGHTVSGSWLATWQDGDYVWHLYESKSALD